MVRMSIALAISTRAKASSVVKLNHGFGARRIVVFDWRCLAILGLQCAPKLELIEYALDVVVVASSGLLVLAF